MYEFQAIFQVRELFGKDATFGRHLDDLIAVEVASS